MNGPQFIHLEIKPNTEDLPELSFADFLRPLLAEGVKFGSDVSPAAINERMDEASKVHGPFGLIVYDVMGNPTGRLEPSLESAQEAMAYANLLTTMTVLQPIPRIGIIHTAQITTAAGYRLSPGFSRKSEGGAALVA